MSISDYLTEYWGVVVLLIGLSIVLFSDMHLERKVIYQMSLAISMLFLYTVTCYVESYFSNLEFYSPMRAVLSAVNYSLITFILVSIIVIVYPRKKIYLLIPAIVNAVLCIVSIPTGIVFYFANGNHFGRGPLGYLTYVVNGLYLIYFIGNLFNSKKNNKEDYPLLIYLVVTAVACLAMPLFMEEVSMHWFMVTIAIEIVLYYVYLLQQNTKRDSLTKLLNRQSYYSDSEKHIDEITSIVAIDMDGLKEINDNQGHKAGDVALKTLADCFWKASSQNHRVYRIGGDEYVILCLESTKDDVKSLIERIRQEVGNTPYSCSIGYAMKAEDSTIDTMYQAADAKLYEEKKKYYERTGKKGRKG